MNYALIFNGKIQTTNPDEFIKKFNELVDETNSESFVEFDVYQIAEYQKIQEPITNTSNAEV